MWGGQDHEGYQGRVCIHWVDGDAEACLPHSHIQPVVDLAIHQAICCAPQLGFSGKGNLHVISVINSSLIYIDSTIIPKQYNLDVQEQGHVKMIFF